MKYLIRIGILCLIISASNAGMAQTKKYFSTSTEMIFSFANISKGGNTIESNLRWSPVFNIQGLTNYDFGKRFGVFHGLAMRNVGFIYEIPGTDTLKKYRTYNVGVPVGFKLGNLQGLFVYGGYEFELPFHYKEKTFVNEDKKEKLSVWFSSRTNWYTQSVFAGINFKSGFNIKFKYYIDPFFNQDYTQTINGQRQKPFSNFDVHVFYLSIDFNVFKDVRSYRKPQPRQADQQYSYRN